MEPSRIKAGDRRSLAWPERTAALLLCGWLIVPLVGCTVPGKMETRLLPENPGKFSDSGEVPAPCRWWSAFGDHQLDRLVSEALSSELTLRSFLARFRAAQATANREAAPLFPQIDGFFTGENRDSQTANISTLELGLTTSYEIDLWGRIQAAVEAEEKRAGAARADYHTVALTLAAEVSRTWFQLAEALAQRSLLESQIETNEKLARQLRNQFFGGQNRSVDVLRQDQLVAATRQQKAAVEASIRVLEHRLSLLLGRPPQEPLSYSHPHLPSLPPLPDTGIPSELVCRRPDVRGALLRLEAADRDVAVAVTDQFPRLTLSADVSTTNARAEDFFDDWIRTLAANLVGPLIDGGRRKAEVARTRAVKLERLFDYGQTVLVAFQEVEDALALEAGQVEQIRHLEEQIDLAEKTYDQLLVEYSNGVSNFIDLLTALTDLQQLRRDLILANRVLLEFRTTLYRALAGDIPLSRPERCGGARATVRCHENEESPKERVRNQNRSSG